MDMDFFDRLLRGIESAQREAAELMLHAKSVMAEMKSGHRDLVTEYDRRVQALLVERLSALLPDSGFFCEENELHDALTGEHVFIIDPIDGTMNFVRSLHRSCISIAYASGGELLLGSVYDPYADELFTAVKGRGARLNGRPIQVEQAPLSETVISIGTSPYSAALTDESFRLARLAMEVGLDIRRFGSAAMDLCTVAAGRSGLYFELQVSTWDYAAGQLIVEEAGGICRTVEGKRLPLDGSKPSIAAGSPQALADFMKLTGRELD